MQPVRALQSTGKSKACFTWHYAFVKNSFLLLNQTTVRKAAEDAMTGASGHRRVPATFYEEMLIPVPPIPVQQQVIDECAKIDEEYNATRMSIETYRQKIADLFAELDVVMSTIGGVQTEPV